MTGAVKIYKTFKSMDWFLYDNGPHHERVKNRPTQKKLFNSCKGSSVYLVHASNFPLTNISYPLIRTRTYMCVSGGKKC